MNILECDVEDAVYHGLINNREELKTRGLDLPKGLVERQLKIGDYGIADIVLFSLSDVDSDRQIVEIDTYIIELKKDQISGNTLGQAMRYAKGLDRMYKQGYLSIIPGYETILLFRYVLIGSSIDNDFLFAPDLNTRIINYEYSFDQLKGFYFERKQGYYRRVENFERIESYHFTESFKKYFDHINNWIAPDEEEEILLLDSPVKRNNSND